LDLHYLVNFSKHFRPLLDVSTIYVHAAAQQPELLIILDAEAVARLIERVLAEVLELPRPAPPHFVLDDLGDSGRQNPEHDVIAIMYSATRRTMEVIVSQPGRVGTASVLDRDQRGHSKVPCCCCFERCNTWCAACSNRLIASSGFGWS